MSTTPFSKIYRRFLSKVTDDQYMELTEEETERLLKELLIAGMHYFEFPRVSLKYDDEAEEFTEAELSDEEINILATYMAYEWIGQQLASVEVTRMKYSGSDFKFTSQANHMAKLKELKDRYQYEGFHLQRVYCRRKDNEKTGGKTSTFSQIMEIKDNYGFKK